MELEVLKNEKNEAEFVIKGERHTFPNLLKSRLSASEDVDFAAYRLDHPTSRDARFYIRTKSKSPASVLAAACRDLSSELEALEKALKKAVK